jgi:precorrin-6B methylase 2
VSLQGFQGFESPSLRKLPGFLGSKVQLHWDRFKLSLLLHRSESLFWEPWLGIRTRIAAHRGRQDDEHNSYQPSPYRSIFRVLRALDLRASDVFVDLGCGKGRVVCCAATQNVARVIGVEDIPELAAMAEENIRQMRRPHRSASIVATKVDGFDFREGTVFYMFNAFGPETLRRVLSKLERSLFDSPRTIRIAYLFPEHETVLHEQRWLQRTGSVRTIHGEATLWSS